MGCARLKYKVAHLVQSRTYHQQRKEGKPFKYLYHLLNRPQALAQIQDPHKALLHLTPVILKIQPELAPVRGSRIPRWLNHPVMPPLNPPQQVISEWPGVFVSVPVSVPVLLKAALAAETM